MNRSQKDHSEVYSLESQESVKRYYANSIKQGATLKELQQKAKTIYKIKPNLTITFLQCIANSLQVKSLEVDDQQKYLKINIYDNLSALYLAKASYPQSQEYLQRAKFYYNLTQTEMAPFRQQNVILRAYILFYSGQLNEALDLLKTNIICYESQVLMANFLLISQIYFAKRQYEKAIQQLKKCLKLFKGMPIQARLAMAYSYYYLNRSQLAEACFKRVLKLEPKCIEALVGLAVICQKNEQFANYFIYIKCAKKIDDSHPLVLLHQAQHHLYRKDTAKVRQISQKGLRKINKMGRIYDSGEMFRNDFYEIQARFWNMIGQSYHIEGNYRQALVYYLKIKKRKLTCMSWNNIQQIQCYTALQDYKNALYSLETHLQSSNAHGQLNKDSKLFNDTYRLLAYLKSKAPHSPQTLSIIQHYFNQALKFNKKDCLLKCELIHFLVANNQLEKAKGLYESLFDDFRQNQYEISAEMYNNRAVILLQLGELQESKILLENALKAVENENINEVDKQGIQIVVLYNSGICAQKNHYYFTAIKIYQQLIAKNRYFTDAYLRMAIAFKELGNTKECLRVLNEGLLFTEDKAKINKPSRIYLLLAYVYFTLGEYTKATQQLELVQEEIMYKRVLRICLEYHQIMRSQDVAANIFFLKQRRLECQRICHEDSSSSFAVFIYWIVTLTLKSINPQCLRVNIPDYKVYQSLQILNQSLQQKHTFPISYCTGIFSIKISRLEAALAIFKQHKQLIDPEINNLIAFCQVLGRQLSNSAKVIKKNVLLNPSDLKQRYRLYYIVLQNCLQQLRAEAWGHSKLNKSNKQKQINSKVIGSCYRFFRRMVNADLSHFNIYEKECESYGYEAKRMQKMRSIMSELLTEIDRLKDLYGEIRNVVQMEEQLAVVSCTSRINKVNMVQTNQSINKKQQGQFSDSFTTKRPLAVQRHQEQGNFVSKKSIVETQQLTRQVRTHPKTETPDIQPSLSNIGTIHFKGTQLISTFKMVTSSNIQKK